MVLHSVRAQVTDRTRSILHKRSEPPKGAWLRSGVSTLMLVAILISTVTFAAGFTVPGSVYNSDGSTPHKYRGMAVLVNRAMFKIFVIFNTVAMYSSSFGCSFLLWARSSDYHLAIRSYWIANTMVGVALVTMSVAFMAAVRLVVSNVSWLANCITIIGVIFLCFISTLRILLGLFPYGFILPLMRLVSDLHLRMAVWLYGSPVKYKNSSASQQEGMQEREY